MKMNKKLNVGLVTTPFWTLNIPSLALSLLKATAIEDGHNASIHYLSLEYAKHIGIDLYNEIGDSPGVSYFLGEWIFGSSAYGSNAVLEQEFEKYCINPQRSDRKMKPLPEDLYEKAVLLRKQAYLFVDRVAQELVSQDYDLIGFGCVFQQVTPSLAIAKKVKEISPNTMIVFGGANCEGEQGKFLIENHSYIDAVFNGEGEVTFKEYLNRIHKKETLFGIPGVYLQGQPCVDRPASLLADLDSLPYVSFDDYFEKLDHLGMSEDIEPELVYESSRGCWWGAKHHCTFCGLNDERMGFRSKSQERAVRELEELVERYPNYRIFTSDNILDVKYFNEFIPRISKFKDKLDIYYELKSNLKNTQIKQLRDAGILSIQPGIESLDDDILKLVDKGATTNQQIDLLVGSEHNGLEVCWNMLYGFPGEKAESYDRMTEFLPLLHHLPPPGFTMLFTLIRFSPYQASPERFEISNILPDPAYSKIYPFTNAELNRFAYYFTYDYNNKRSSALESSLDDFKVACISWSESYRYSVLFLVERKNSNYIVDTRDVSQKPVYELSSLEYHLLTELRQSMKKEVLVKNISDSEYLKSDILRSIDNLVELGYCIEVSGKIVSLVIHMNEYRSGGRDLEPFYREQKNEIVRKILSTEDSMIKEV